MKKLLTLALMLVLVFALASCSFLPEDIEATINGFLGIGGPSDQPDEHTEHNFVLAETIKATCEEDGAEVYRCECGEEQRTTLPATGHNVQLVSSKESTCIRKGSETYRCFNCGGLNETIYYDALGHDFGTATEPSRFTFCNRAGCEKVNNKLDADGKYKEDLTFDFTADHETEITAKLTEIMGILDAAPKYDPALHGYAESGALADEYKTVDDLHTELYDLVMHVIAQRQIAEIDYYCNMSNSELEERYSYMMDYYTALIADFYSLSQPFYDSCYRDFYYYGMTEAEINEYLFDSNAVSNPEYTALKSRNDELELLVLELNYADPQIPELYKEFVENSNKMAQILLGDPNATYLDYAYENVYGREYTPDDVALITEYVGKHLSGVYESYYSIFIKNYVNCTLAGTDRSDYKSQVEYSFFENQKSNITVNDYIDKMSFTANPDKQISFSDELNGLVTNGNLYRGVYSGAFVTYISTFDIPIAYFSSGYDTPFTIVHEFGHYMNEVYNRSEYEQSYDLLEMHSQGNEMLYLAALKGQITDAAYEQTKVDHIAEMLNTVMASLAIDAFERAIYTDSYSGANEDVIMADNTITPDEYDMLFKSVLKNLGADGKVNEDYWRYGMTFRSPCYYVSYAVSALSVMQLYTMAETDGFDAASEAYLKLFTYTDVDPEMNDEEVLNYAGLYLYTDEALYSSLGEFLSK